MLVCLTNAFDPRSYRQRLVMGCIPSKKQVSQEDGLVAPIREKKTRKTKKSQRAPSPEIEPPPWVAGHRKMTVERDGAGGTTVAIEE